jgi:hypothetical protein
MRQLTIRNVSPQIGRELDRASKRSGKSINALVLELLDAAFERSARRRRLMSYATWTAAEAKQFDARLRKSRKIDRDMWR